METANVQGKIATMRADLPPLPDRMKHLPIDPDRGYPVPFFVPWINGKPEFRTADPNKIMKCLLSNLCWVCGQSLGRNMAFVLGPMCIVNRVSVEPPSHLECAEYSCRACPFLTKPYMERRENDLPEGCVDPAGIMERRNPDCVAVWVTRQRSIIPQDGGVLIKVGDPISVTWWAQGRIATPEEVRVAFDASVALLRKKAEEGGPDDVALFEKWLARARPYVP